MPRGRPRTRTDHASATTRVIRIMMDIRPKLPSHQSPPEMDIPMSTTNLVTAPIFASIASTMGNGKPEKEGRRGDGQSDRDHEARPAEPPRIAATEAPSPLPSPSRPTHGSLASPREARQQLKPFICFYCGFQCDNHLMRHRCVPKKKRRTLSVDFENYDPRRNHHHHHQPAMCPATITTTTTTTALLSVNQMESEAAEILSIMLQGAC